MESASGLHGRREVVSEPVFRWWDHSVFLALTALNLAALGLFVRHWLSLDFDAVTVVLTVVLLYAASVHALSWLLLPLMRRPRPMPPRPGWRVAAVTSFVPGAEPLEMLEETLRAMVAMEYPHDTWVLDEGDDERVRALCERLGAFHFSRKQLPQYQAESGRFQSDSKVGNYNAWLEQVGFERYELLAAFDPDHVPERDFLLNVVGYFDDPRIGYVQAPQVYYNQEASFIARGAAEETYAFYSTGQMASYAWGYPIITGSHSTHRVAALREVGGLPAHDGDDLLLTLIYRAAGWRGVYVPKVLARGMTPVDWPGYLRQQLRWARSVLDVKFRAFPRLAGNLPLKERLLGLLHGLYYLQGLWTAVTTALLAFMLLTGRSPEAVSYATAGYLLLVLAAYLPAHLYRQRFFLDWRRQRGLHARAWLLHAAKWPFLVQALLEVVLGRRRPYVLTPKLGRGSRERLLLVPHLCITGVVGGTALLGMALGRTAHPLLYLWATATVLTSLGLIWTESWRFPEPYDRELWRRQPALRMAITEAPVHLHPEVDAPPAPVASARRGAASRG